MRIRVGFADGVQDIVIGELENTPEGIKTYGKHKRWLRNIVADHRRIPASTALAHTHLGLTRADITPDRLDADRCWFRLTDEQVLRDIVDYFQRCTYNWAQDITERDKE